MKNVDLLLEFNEEDFDGFEVEFDVVECSMVCGNLLVSVVGCVWRAGGLDLDMIVGWDSGVLLVTCVRGEGGYFGCVG